METGSDEARAATIEHLVTRRDGGSGRDGNLVAACRGCNGARPPHQSALQFFELRQGFLKDDRWPQCTTPSASVQRRLVQAPRPAGQHRSRFTLGEVFEHIEQHHPGCPTAFRGELAHLVAGRGWGDASLGTAFGITATRFVRDSFTEFNHLRGLVGEAEARLAVRPVVARILALWGNPEPPADEAPAREWKLRALQRPERG